MPRYIAAASSAHPRIGSSTTKSAVSVTGIGTGTGTTCTTAQPSTTIAAARTVATILDRCVISGNSLTNANAASTDRHRISTQPNKAGTRTESKPGNAINHENGAMYQKR